MRKFTDNDLLAMKLEKQTSGKNYLDKEEKGLTSIPEPQGSAYDLLQRCRQYWDNAEDVRERRRRAARFNRGEQWGDLIYDPESDDYLTEEDYIKAQGKVPLKQNKVRQLMKNLVGQFRSAQYKSIVMARDRDKQEISEMMSNALQYVNQSELMKELDARNFEEFAISGMPVQKIRYDWVKERNIWDVVIDNVNPNRLFWNTDIRDIRGRDLSLIGEIHDAPIEKIITWFAKNKKDEDRIKELYASYIQDPNYVEQAYVGKEVEENLDFFSSEPGKCRVYEIWSIESQWRIHVHDLMDGTYEITDTPVKELEAENEARLQRGIALGLSEEQIPLLEYDEMKEEYWTVKYVTPEGHIITEMETPFEHEEHPYIFMPYPLIDGEIWGFIEDIIDQQKYINRLITLMDFIISASAKGLLMVPEDAIPENSSPEEFAEQYTKVNGVIVYKPSTKHNRVPEQISSNSTNLGVHELLGMQMRFMQEVSGVHDAIQGRSPSAGTPAVRYQQETQNASLNSLDIMEFYGSFRQRREMKVIKLIKQFYTEKRHLSISGASFKTAFAEYDPEKVGDTEFTNIILQNQNADVFRQAIDDTLTRLLEMQQIDIEMFLENTSLPFADKILESIRTRKQDMGGMLPPEAMGDIMQQQAVEPNPKSMNMLNKALGYQQN